MVRVTMDIFQHRYYRLGKMLMLLTGQWPYQSILTRYGILAVGILLIAYQVVAQILAAVKYGDDWNILLQCFVPNVFDAVCASKYLGFMYNSQKILKLLDRIRMDWHVWARHQEVKILHKYAKWGANITIVYTATIYSAMFVFMIQPMVTKLIDVVLKNSTEPGKFLFPVVYYHLDVQKYYLYLIIYITVCALVILTPFASSEVMLIIYVQHVCAIFAAVGYLHGHNKCTVVRFADLIRASYAWNIFFTIVFGMILINASGLQMLLRTNDIGETLTFMMLSLGTLICFYLECSISQILIDHSLSIRFYISNSQWYKLPPKTQKMLQLIAMSCNVPCHLTAGNMLVMSLRTFGLTMRTTMSYFAFMRSTQGI